MGPGPEDAKPVKGVHPLQGSLSFRKHLTQHIEILKSSEFMRNDTNTRPGRRANSSSEVLGGCEGTGSLRQLPRRENRHMPCFLGTNGAGGSPSEDAALTEDPRPGGPPFSVPEELTGPSSGHHGVRGREGT